MRVGDFWTILIECVVVGLIVLTLLCLIAMFDIFRAAKGLLPSSSAVSVPMRVGPWGSVQVVADVLKMLIKEIFGVDRSDKFLYALAPFLTIIASVGTFSFLPWNKGAAVPCSACLWSLPSAASASWASSFRDGAPTTSIPSSLPCVVPCR